MARRPQEGCGHGLNDPGAGPARADQTIPLKDQMLPKTKPSRKAQKQQAKMPGVVRFRKPAGETIGLRNLDKVRRKRAK